MIADVDVATLQARRLQCWRQTHETRIPDPAAAAELIERVGIATLFPASPEVPNLYHAHVGDPGAAMDAEWDSPAGRVYGWRWALGRREAAFYTAIIRSRPTWVSWALLPAVLCLRGESRTPDELFDAGELTAGAYRIAEALDAAAAPLSTGELRRQAGFPTGKEQRAAYLKAVAELDTRLLVAKVFSADDDMRHTLVSTRYPRHVAAAATMTRDAALEQFLLAYLPHAVYAAPAVLAKQLQVPEAELRAGLDRLAATNQAAAISLPGQKGACYAWL